MKRNTGLHRRRLSRAVGLALATATALAFVADAQAWAPVIQLGDLDGSNGFRADGAAGDVSGWSVAGVGDINGDGIDDVVIGAYGADINGPNAGSSYVVFGRSDGFAASLDLDTLDGSNGFRVDGPMMGDASGFSVSGAGDVNGDGLDDLVIGAPGSDPNGDRSGSSYVVFGRNNGFPASLDLDMLDGGNGFRLDGAAEADFSGEAVAGAGDINGDGVDDLVIGAHGADSDGADAGSSYVVFGHTGSFTAILQLSALDGSNGFRVDGAGAGDRSGFSVAGAGDINGDGVDDLVIGAGRADSNGADAGSSYVVFGHTGGFASSLSLSALDGISGFRLDGVAANDYSGFSVAGAGDINGDGVDDLVIGAPTAGPNVSYSGSSYVFFGHIGGFAASIELGALDGGDGFRIDGASIGEDSGWSVAGACDINGDGIEDVIIGAPDAHPNYNSQSGSSYVVFGRPGGFGPSLTLSVLDGRNGFRLDGVAKHEYSGR